MYVSYFHPDLFVQQCHLWRQAGHTEKAVAAFQAMVELNCFCPDNLGETTPLKGQVCNIYCTLSFWVHTVLSLARLYAVYELVTEI